MDFGLGETEMALAAVVSDFARRELAPRAAERDRVALFPEAEMRQMGQLGLLGVNVPEELGGAAAGPLALAVVVREIAAADASVAVTLAVTNMVAEVLTRFGTPGVRTRWVPPLVAGHLVAGSFALSESGAGSDAAALRTVARRVPGGYQVSGSKLWITSGRQAGVLIVMARMEAIAGVVTARPCISAFVVAQGAPGLSAGRAEEKLGQHGSHTVPLVLDDVFVPADHLLGNEGDGLKIALTALDGGRIAVASQALGIATAAHAAALTYAQTRVQFGTPLSSFPAIAAMLADNAVALEAAWTMILAAVHARVKGLPDLTRRAAQAKLFSTEQALAVCDRSLQIHGGYGYTREFPLERYFRDVRVTTIYEGTSQIQRLVIARELLKNEQRKN